MINGKKTGYTQKNSGIFHDLEVSENNLKDTGQMASFLGVTLYMSINKSEMEIDKKVKHNKVQSAANSTQVAKQLEANSRCGEALHDSIYVIQVIKC